MRVAEVVMAALFVVLLAGVVALGCDSRRGVVHGDAGCLEDAGCSMVGCAGTTGVVGPSAWEVGVSVPVTDTAVTDLAGCKLTGCRNDACSSGTLASPPELNTRGYFTMAPGNKYLEADLYRPVNGPPFLEVGWGRQVVNDLPDPQDGDAYSVELRTATGVLVVAVSGEAIYRVTYPNGPCCEPACLAGTFMEITDGGAAP